MHEEEMSKILVYLKGFTEDERLRLAQITALWLASGQIPASTLRVLINVRILNYPHNIWNLIDEKILIDPNDTLSTDLIFWWKIMDFHLFIIWY